MGAKHNYSLLQNRPEIQRHNNLPIEDSCRESDSVVVPSLLLVCWSPAVTLSLGATDGVAPVLCWFTTPDNFSIGFSRQLTVVTKFGLARSKLWGTRAKSFTSPFFSSNFITLLGCCDAACWAAEWGPFSIMVCTNVKIAWSLECFVVDSGTFKARPREAFISAMRVCCASGAWWQVAMVARRVRAHDGVSSPSLDVPAGRRWSRTKASTGPSYFGNIVIKPVSINVSKSVFY